MQTSSPSCSKSEPLKAEQLFQKALLFLDRGYLHRGEAALRSAMEAAREDEDSVLLVRALVCLADLLSQSGRVSEAQVFSREALSYQSDPCLEEADDVLEREFSSATELLSTKTPDDSHLDT